MIRTKDFARQIVKEPKKLCRDQGNSVATESKKEHREQVATDDCMLQQRPAMKILKSFETKLPGCDRECNLGQNFGDPQCSLEFRA